ncbi:uncharacterized protein LY89DRAFT_679607 [Mollisia scopiformis]|uniref:Uncharacterized protein n=1 Tax=Mollisia scopiformis TaxID=149040 RepID=A0A194XXF4_MOLSC|nr:uncharacterized protein LY89DRAFT_679607 [Mollisia scopiformis]KUJ24472.1 hypothetical protein LY89DRAFT_679607 [Mollisia scopiformis]
MSYSRLPNEIIVQFVTLVASSDIDNFARVDRRTYALSLDRLRPRQALKKNAKFIAARFGDSMKPFNSISRGHMRSTNRIYGPDALVHLDYLELNGDLQWLQPMDQATIDYNTWPRLPDAGIPKENLDALVESGRRVGIEFPKAFLTLMASTELMERMFLGGDFFYLGLSLIKCKPEDDNDGGGYVVTFLSDQQGCGYWALYVTPSGYHCVLNTRQGIDCWKCMYSDADGRLAGPWDDHPKYQVYEGVPIACDKLDFALAHPNFEAWLAMNYFDAWCRLTLEAGRELAGYQREYLEHFGGVPSNEDENIDITTG